MIPTLFLILGWRYQPERVQTGIYLFYTLLASLPLLVGILFIYASKRRNTSTRQHGVTSQDSKIQSRLCEKLKPQKL
jgi:NADH:ubiquinone oxidoreductase subunit 4 (subunit M)